MVVSAQNVEEMDKQKATGTLNILRDWFPASCTVVHSRSLITGHGARRCGPNVAFRRVQLWCGKPSKGNG